MFMKFCIAAAVALGCILAVPSASFAAGDKGKSATSTTTEPKAAKHTAHKKKKGHSDEEHENPRYPLAGKAR
jgi:hypothetical protein